MGQEESVSIRPAWGSPSLKKNARLSFQRGVLEAADGRGRTRTFTLSDGGGPYHFAYGEWAGDADFALIDRSGEAVLVLHMADFKNDEFMKLQDATGLKAARSATRPPSRSDAFVVLSPPYLKWARWAFLPGAVAFGLWSVTHVDILVLGITLPAVVIMSVLFVLAKMSMMSQSELRQEWQGIKPQTDEALAIADAFLAEHGQPPVSQPDDPTAEAPPPRPAPPDAPPHGH
jgi:hypothetical protein